MSAPSVQLSYLPFNVDSKLGAPFIGGLISYSWALSGRFLHCDLHDPPSLWGITCIQVRENLWYDMVQVLDDTFWPTDIHLLLWPSKRSSDRKTVGKLPVSFYLRTHWLLTVLQIAFLWFDTFHACYLLLLNATFQVLGYVRYGNHWACNVL